MSYLHQKQEESPWPVCHRSADAHLRAERKQVKDEAENCNLLCQGNPEGSPVF